MMICSPLKKLAIFWLALKVCSAPEQEPWNKPGDGLNVRLFYFKDKYGYY